MKIIVRLSLVLFVSFVACPIKQVLANSCTTSNYVANYVGDPIPLFDERIGETLGRIDVSFNYNCTFTDAHTMIIFGTWGQKSYKSGKIYNSNLPGIQLTTPRTVGTSGPHNNSVIFKTIHGSESGTISGPLFYVQKIASFTSSPSGTNPTFNLGTSHIDHNLQVDVFRPGASFGIGQVNKLGFVDVPIEIPTCDIDTAHQDQTVTLPSVNIGDFGAVGSTSGRRPFSITLHCARRTRIHATITDLNARTNTGTNMTLSSSSTATGVSLQFSAKVDDTIRSFGSANRFYWKGSHADSDAMSWTVPVAVRYVKTQQNMTAGTVNAKMEILFDYE
ncbi:fimbrial protein [Vibrio sp. SBT000027]|uniref:fimbrial protein n=1 Tax=Vibrio sp. SBT000027 TaxID=1803384 RepID=UPI000EF44D0A|nr:fimbrial protein [Vibrio sp. SBT000027]RLQ17077.1 type 1 fimbrial protein [Vibrio sp. SBT000027]